MSQAHAKLPGRAEFFHQGKEIAGRRHINPDNSEGGFVPVGMEIPATAYIHPTAVVLPGATVEANARIERGQIVAPPEFVP